MQPQEIKKRFRFLTVSLITVGMISLATLGLYLFKISKDVRPADSNVRIISNMSLTEENLRAIFSPMQAGVDTNDIKLIKYDWYTHSSGALALQAYGMSDGGVQLSRAVRLTIPANITTVTWKNSQRPAAYGNTRGELKYVLNSQVLGQDVVILDPEYRATINVRPSTLTVHHNGVDLKVLDLQNNSQVGRANPAPPFTFSCVNCDNM